jgi:spore maturation protein CgeB
VDAVLETFGWMNPGFYDPRHPQVERLTEGADLVLVHEWTDPAVVAAIGRNRAAGGYRLLFHDTHHRAVTAPEEMARYDLSDYDGVLAFGQVLRDLYLGRGWTGAAWTWHEAADTRLFGPRPDAPRRGELVWIGNWGDGERSAELRSYLLEPVRRLDLRAQAYGVRYPHSAQRALAASGIGYAGRCPSHRVPEIFAGFGVTLHVPRRPYVEALPGIPTIRPFEALACGIPLVCAPWDDAEGLFTPGEDFLVAHGSAQTVRAIREVVHETALAQRLREHGAATIAARHTCAHRVDELLTICQELGMETESARLRGSNA